MAEVADHVVLDPGEGQVEHVPLLPSAEDFSLEAHRRPFEHLSAFTGFGRDEGPHLLIVVGGGPGIFKVDEVGEELRGPIHGSDDVLPWGVRQQFSPYHGAPGKIDLSTCLRNLLSFFTYTYKKMCDVPVYFLSVVKINNR